MGVTPLMREAGSAMTFAALHGVRNCYRFFQAKEGRQTGAVPNTRRKAARRVDAKAPHPFKKA